MNKYTKYAEEVVTGKITACNNIKLACQRYLDWFNRVDFEFKPHKVDKVVNFISNLKHYKGSHNKQPFILQPYQYWIICNIFGFYHKGTNKRVIRYAYLEMARKSGKTALVSAILLYMLIADGEPSAECEMVANNAKQAKICFTMASNYLSTIDPKGKYFRRFRDSIKFDKTKSVLQVLSSVASGNDGYNSHAFVLDEAHEQKDSRLWDVMVSSQGARKNPLGIIITTAGFNLYGFCYQYRLMCQDILNGLKQDDTQFSAIFSLDDTDDFTDPNVWVKANPSLGVTVDEDYLAQQVQRAKNDSNFEVGVRTKNFNQWVSASDIWIRNNIVLKSTQKVDLDDYKGCIAYCGVDLSEVCDLTAVSLCILKDDKYIFKTKYYLPESVLDGNSNMWLYREWSKKGMLTITKGETVDYNVIISDLLKAKEKVDIQCVGYDTYNAKKWSKDMVQMGFNMKEYSQSLLNFNYPTKEFERKIKSGEVIIDDNEITRWCISNVELMHDHCNNVKPGKGENQKKIDGVIAMIEALGTYLTLPQYDYDII